MAEELRVIMVDDEAPARRLLREYLEDTPGVSIVAECGNGFEAVKAVAEHQPDLMLLDIQMPKLDGFEVAAPTGAFIHDRAPNRQEWERLFYREVGIALGLNLGHDGRAHAVE